MEAGDVERRACAGETTRRQVYFDAVLNSHRVPFTPRCKCSFHDNLLSRSTHVCLMTIQKRGRHIKL